MDSKSQTDSETENILDDPHEQITLNISNNDVFVIKMKKIQTEIIKDDKSQQDEIINNQNNKLFENDDYHKEFSVNYHINNEITVELFDKDVQHDKIKKNIKSANVINNNQQQDKIIINQYDDKISDNIVQKISNNQSINKKSTSQSNFYARLQGLSKIIIQQAKTYKLYVIIFPLTIAVFLLVNYIDNNYQVQCIYENKELEYIYCKDDRSYYIKRAINIFFFDIGLIGFLYYSFQHTFKHSFKLVTALFILLYIMDIVYRLEQLQFQSILWTAFLIVMIYIKFKKKIKVLNLIELNFYQVIYQILYQLYVIIVLKNRFNLSRTERVMITNTYFVTQNIILKNYLKNSFKLNQNNTEGYRYMLLLVQLIDTAWIFQTIISNTFENMLKSGFFINVVVMMVYNISQFHLYFYLFEQLVLIIWKNCHINFCLNLRDKILYIIRNIVWLDFEQYINQIKQTYYDEPSIQYQTIQESDIFKIQARSYIQAQIYCIILVLLMLVTNLHFPSQTSSQIDKYYKYNNNKKYLDGKLHLEIYSISYVKLLIYVGMLLIVYIAILIYQKYQKVEFFSYRIQPSPQNKLRLFIVLTFGYIFNDVMFI